MRNEQLKVNIEKIKERRESLGIQSKDVAKALGIKRQLYSNKETGRTQFSDAEKTALAKILGFTLEEMNEYLFEGELPPGIITAKKDKS